ncbi:MAG: zinc ribbon domain-containing protein [Planctomycetota bacterium]|jgi:hypothetical protein
MQDLTPQIAIVAMAGVFVVALTCQSDPQVPRPLPSKNAVGSSKNTTCLVALTCQTAPPISRPLGAEPAADVPENTMYVYWDANFGGGDPHQVHRVTSHSHGVPLNFEDQKFLRNIRDDMSSLKWNLPEGVIVIFYEDAAARGERIVVWGQGQIRSLRSWGFNDKVSRWAWYYVGGSPPPCRHAFARAEYGVSPLTVALNDSVQMWQHTGFRGDRDSITRMTNHPEGVLLPVTADLRDAMSSLRWSLPEGIVVIFYANANGKGNRIAVWGEGEIPKLRHWDFNDQLSRWAWYSVAPRSSPGASRLSSCTGCGHRHPMGAKYCRGCSTRATVTAGLCTQCGRKRTLGRHWSYCPNCGKRLVS